MHTLRIAVSIQMAKAPVPSSKLRITVSCARPQKPPCVRNPSSHSVQAAASYHLRLLIQQQRAPLAAHAHRRHNRAVVHLAHPPEPVGVAIVVEIAHSPHSPIPGGNMALHVLKRQPEAKPPQVRPHMLRHPIALTIKPAHTIPISRWSQFPVRSQCVKRALLYWLLQFKLFEKGNDGEDIGET